MDENLFQEEEKLYNFLKVHLPTNSRSLLYQCSKEIEDIRQRLLVQQRMIHYFSLLSINNYPKQHLPEHSKLVDFIFNENNMAINSADFPSDFIQDASIFIPHIYDNLGQFAQGVIRSTKSPFFEFIINSTIPSLFGNFASDEYIKLASVFYTHVVGNGSPEISIQILAPFYQSLPTFRFIESVMTPFSIHYGSEIRLLEISKSVNNSQVNYGQSIHNIGNELLRYIDMYLPLIPSTHLVLMSLVRSLGWSQGHLNYFFFHQFFIHEAKKWLESSPYAGHYSFFQDIIKEAFSLQEMSKILAKLPKISSFYELPSLCQTAGQSFLLLYTSPLDIVMAAKVLLKVNDNPSLDHYRKKLNLSQINPDIHFRSLWIKVFPTSVGKSLMPSPSWNFDSTPHTDISLFLKKKNIFPIFLSSRSSSSDCIKQRENATNNNETNNNETNNNETNNNETNNNETSNNETNNNETNNNKNSINETKINKNNNKSESEKTEKNADELTKADIASFNSLYYTIERNKSTNNLSVYDSIIDKSIYTFSLTDESKDKFVKFALEKNINSLLFDVKNFEQFFNYELQRKRLEDNLLHDSCSLYNATFALVATDKSYDFLTNKLKEIRLLSLIRPHLIALQNKYKPDFSALAKLWKAFAEEIKELSQSKYMRSLNETKLILFWECVEQLKTLVIIPLVFRFQVFNNVMKKIKFIKNKKEFIFNVLVMSNNEKIITSFSLFMSCLVKSEICKFFLSDDLNMMWTEFDSTFLSYLPLARNERLSSLFIDLQYKLTEEVAQVWDKLKAEIDYIE